MFECINRDGLIIFPKKAFFDWINSVFPEDTVEVPELMSHESGKIYLLPESDSSEDAMIYLKKNFRNIFEQELFDWCTDEDAWPKNLSWKLFEEWFHYSLQSMVMDTLEEEIVKDS